MEIAGFDRLKATAAATVQTDLQKSAVQAQTQREDTMRAQRVEQRADNEGKNRQIDERREDFTAEQNPPCQRWKPG